MFNKLLKNRSVSGPIIGKGGRNTVEVYPVSEYNLEGIKILIENTIKWGEDKNNMDNIMKKYYNVGSVVSINPEIWLGDFLNKHWDKISYISLLPNFSILKIDSGQIVEKFYKVTSDDFDTDEKLDNFLLQGKWKKLVIYSISKYADLSTMTTFYNLRYADVTEKFEERDRSIDVILDEKDMPF